MATIMEVNGRAPTIGEDVWLAPTAVLVGDVRVGDRANVWFGAVLRGDYSHIEVGAAMLAAGVPAREKKQLSGSALQWTETAVVHYQDLRHQYLIGYSPGLEHWDGRFRNVQLLARNGKYVVRTRKGYYANP